MKLRILLRAECPQGCTHREKGKRTLPRAPGESREAHLFPRLWVGEKNLRSEMETSENAEQLVNRAKDAPEAAGRQQDAKVEVKTRSRAGESEAQDAGRRSSAHTSPELHNVRIQKIGRGHSQRDNG